MKHTLIITSLTAVSFLPLMSFAADNVGSIKQCSELLPAGYKFTIEIQAKVDTTKNPQTFNGNFMVSDNKGEQTDLSENAIKPFLTCAIPLLNGEIFK